MASAFFRIWSRTGAAKTLKANATVSTRIYNNEAGRPIYAFSKFRDLLRDPKTRLAPVLDQWLKEGGSVNHRALPKFIKVLRARKRYGQALEVYEWISRNRQSKLSQTEHAIQLELIGRVRGLEAAECYIKSLDSEDKVGKTYGALLFCYSIEGDVEKSLSLMHKMKELGFASSTLCYNNIMTAYTRSGQLEKVPDVLSEMKENSVMPDAFSYRSCINSYGKRGDIDSMETILKEAESQPHIVFDWLTYASIGNIYIKAGQKLKALVYLRKCEALDSKGQCYSSLISHYANLGNKDEMMRLWGLMKVKLGRPPNMEYMNMLGCLIKLGEFEESEKLLKEWEASCHFYDFRVPNTLIIGYSKKGLVEKAEAILRGIIESRETVVPTCWSIIAAGYESKQNMEKAFECMKSALALQAENKWWRLEPAKFSGVLSWLGDNGNVEDVEEFVRLLEVNVPRNREMYHALVKAYIRGGKSVNELVDRMKDDKIDEDEETKRILNSIR